MDVPNLADVPASMWLTAPWTAPLCVSWQVEVRVKKTEDGPIDRDFIQDLRD